MGNLIFSNPQPKYGYILNTVYRFICCSEGIMKGFFHYFLSLRVCFLEVETRLDANSLCRFVCLITWLKRPQNSLITNILKGQMVQKQSVCDATLDPLIYSKSIPWYLAAHSCSTTGLRSTWPLPKPLAPTS